MWQVVVPHLLFVGFLWSRDQRVTFALSTLAGVNVILALAQRRSKSHCMELRPFACGTDNKRTATSNECISTSSGKKLLVASCY